ncbi:MAG: hypothetical protein C0490_09790 [Marivirga sp.]|nr:hypothetical protein [Marivirga sp.]
MKYEIYMEGYLPQTATIIIEAKDVEEAEQLALDLADEGEVCWEDCDQSCYRTDVVEISEIEDDVKN